MEDKLKKFVQENRQAFDRLQPSPRVWQRIREEIPVSHEVRSIAPVKTKRPVRIWYAAASIAAIFVLAGVLWTTWEAGETSNQQANQQLAKRDDVAGKDTAESPHIRETDKPVETLASEKGRESEQILSDGEIKSTATNRLASTNKPASVADQKTPTIEAVASVKEADNRNAYTETYALLSDESSAINRMEGVLQIGTLETIPEEGMEQIQRLMEQDPNENVRLAAYDIFMERTAPETREQYVQDAFLQQRDPAMQMELMQAMVNESGIQINDATTKRLEAITADPLAMDLMKTQAYAVLMKNW